jgi:DNA-binding transcriptional ArsR family regulator
MVGLAMGSLGETPKPNRTLAQAGTPCVKATDRIRAIGAIQRRRILRTLHKAGEARSPNELSKAVHTSLSHVSYHVRVLTECGVVALTDTRPRRGAVEHFYASTVIRDELVIKLLEDTRAEDGE